MEKIRPYLLFFLFVLFSFYSLFSQNPLNIPDTLHGPVYNLSVQTGTTTFFQGYNTPTWGYNGNLLGPTLIMNKGDDVTIHVKNNLSTTTTVHWHGLHVPAIMDGGPHQLINAGTTWSPNFKILNNASTFWYHPHGHMKTEIQVTKGLAGLIIIKDSAESTYNLPRTYGVDDFPVIVQSKAFDLLYQLASATHEDSVILVNGTMDPYLNIPKQVVRLRLLNGSADRTFNFGFSDSSEFHLIASDGGLLEKPHPTKRLRLSSGERAEILVDFGKYNLTDSVYLMSYASELSRGIIGADTVGSSAVVISEGYYDNKLNGNDFSVLRFNIDSTTASAVTTIPAAFATIKKYNESEADINRTLIFTPDTSISGMQGLVDGPFLINKQSFHMDSVNIVSYLNDIEIWSLINHTMVAHPFHIHDIEFFVLDINGNPPPPEYTGFKDVILVKPNDTVRFITKFINFANDSVPYMYHCHLLHHEDEGMMGSFIVIDTMSTNRVDLKWANKKLDVFPNPASETLNIRTNKNFMISQIFIQNLLGETVFNSNMHPVYEAKINIRNFQPGIYFLTILTKEGNIQTKKIFIE